jgi:putative acetyltransferase
MASIRKAAQSDAFRLAEIEVFDYRLHFYHLFKTDRYFFSELNVPVLIREYQDEPERIERTYVYEDDGVVKGFVRVNGEEIEKLFVETVFQGMGIGGALLEHVIRNTKANHLLVLEKNEGAIRLYERHGFHMTKQRQRVDDTEEYFVRMERWGT